MIKSKGERIFDVINIIIMVILAAMFIVPALMIVDASFTGTAALSKYGYSLIIRNFSFEYYAALFTAKGSLFFITMLNSVFITLIATVLCVFMTTLYAYAVTRKQLKFRKLFIFILIIPMLFAGGTIPYYLVINDLGLMNTQWAIILPSSINAWFILLVKNFIIGIPESLNEAAELEGANNFQVLFKVIVPLGFPIIATIILYVAVAVWNDWFQASLFLNPNDQHLWPVQTFVKELQGSDEFVKGYIGENTGLNFDGVRAAAVVISLVPIVAVYPFLQRFFIDGVLVGGVKE